MKQKKTIQYSLMPLCFIFVISIFFTACQKSTPESYQESEHTPPTQVAAPDINALCQNLKTEMRNMSNQRSTLALEQINQSIRMCLSIIDFSEQKKLMRLSAQMYKQFLMVERTPEQQQAFERYILDKSQYPTLQQHHFETLNTRDQYLLRHQGQAYITLHDDGVNKINYQRSPQYLAKVFAAYLPDAESVFIQELAEQNMQPAIKENILKVSAQEINRRITFWEKYQQDFPKSSYQQDARYLTQFYTDLRAKISADASAQNPNNDTATLETNSARADQQSTQISVQFKHRPSRDCFADAVCH